MKHIKYISLAVLIGLIFTACKKDFVNINAPADDQIFTNTDGLIAASIGMAQHFSSSTLSPIVEVPGLSTREFGVTSTYVTPMELVKGGDALTGENAGIVRLWSRLLRDKAQAELIIKNAGDVEMDPGTKSGILAFAKLMKAMTLGYLIQNFEQAPITTMDNAPFSNRADVLAECISLLQSAKSDLAANAVSDEFQDKVIPTIDLPNTVNAFLARYNLFAGNYDDAITAANAVDLSVKSEWWYDASENKNPVYGFAVEGSPDTEPQDSFGLLGTFAPEPGDGRIDFYLAPFDSASSPDLGGQPIDHALGFFATADTKIPVYLPGEMLLIKAEAYAMKNDLANAVKNINLVREKTNDVFGVNAGLAAWTGNASDKTAVLNEIYRNRCIELFMSGMRLEDSRRIHSSFTPSAAADVVSERNRNYYPYSYEERNNNENCPADPSI